MKTVSFLNELAYNEDKPTPAIKVMMESEAGKEIRIAFRKGQSMKKHQAPFPIVVQVFDGEIDFGVNDEERVNLKKGDMIALDGKVPHDLIANMDSIIRLSLSKKDSVQRVHEEFA